MKKIYIIISSLIACICLYFVEQVMLVNYLVKTIAKVILFVGVPYIYIKYVDNSTLKKCINYKKINKKHTALGIIYGLISFIIILITYYLLNSKINLSSIISELQNKSKITSKNFIFVGMYITIINSLLEEFFFRGFIFLNLYRLGLNKMAYVYSAVLFGIYHIAIFKTWFNIWLIGLALLGLIGVSFIFNWLDTKSQNFVNSWIVHIAADSAIIVIGLKLFKII